MRPGPCLLLVLLPLTISAGTTVYAQDKGEWPAIPAADLTTADSALRPGVPAIILLKREFRDDVKRTTETFYRIKILTESGRRYADIEIPYVRKLIEVDNIAARVIQADGRAAEFRGPIYERTLMRQGRTGVMAKTFTLPGIKPGVIIDYRYVKKNKTDLPIPGAWIVQDALFIRRAELDWRPAIEGFEWQSFARSLPSGAEMRPAPNQKGVLRASLDSVPAFQQEPLMPPEETVQMRYLLYPRYPFSFSEDRIRLFLNTYVGKSNALAAAVKEITLPQDAPADKVLKLYNAVQEKIRNLSYEEEFTKKERQRESIRLRESAQDVWKLGYGSSDEIVFLFVALCRAAGFNADAIGVIQRTDQFYDQDVPRIDQINGWVAVVDVAGASRTYDPGVRFAPAGWVAWPKQGVQGIRFGQSIQNVDLPLRRVDENQLRRKVSLALQADGSAEFQVATTYSGEDAVERRNEFFDLPKLERERALQDELKDLFPTAGLKDITWQGMDDARATAQVSYRFSVKGFAQVLGDRLIVPPRLFDRPSPFLAGTRTHPIYLRRSLDNFQEVRVEPPPGYRLEEPLPSQEHRMSLPQGTPGLYVSSTTQDAAGVTRVTRLTTYAVYIPPTEYGAVKRFYDQVAASERLNLVFRKQ